MSMNQHSVAVETDEDGSLTTPMDAPWRISVFVGMLLAGTLIGWLQSLYLTHDAVEAIHRWSVAVVVMPLMILFGMTLYDLYAIIGRWGKRRPKANLKLCSHKRMQREIRISNFIVYGSVLLMAMLLSYGHWA